MNRDPISPPQGVAATERAKDVQICLLGQPPLNRFIDFAEDLAADGAHVDRLALVSAWRAASQRCRELERLEADIADHGEPGELDAGVAALAAELQSHPAYRSSFDTLPTRLGMVELDRLVVHQWHVTRRLIDQVQARIGAARDPATLFRICMPVEPPDLPVEVRHLGGRRLAFRCDAEDFDFREPALLGGMEVGDGFAVARAVGLALGFGANLLSVVRLGRRVLLNNGYHRACALRALGITHAPCAIETATCLDELRLTVNGRVAGEIGAYLESPRPPLLKDFFDPALSLALPIRRRVRQIEVEFVIRDALVPR